MAQTRSFATIGPSLRKALSLECPPFLSSLNHAVWISFNISLPSQNVSTLRVFALRPLLSGLYHHSRYINLDIRNDMMNINFKFFITQIDISRSVHSL